MGKYALRTEADDKLITEDVLEDSDHEEVGTTNTTSHWTRQPENQALMEKSYLKQTYKGKCTLEEFNLCPGDTVRSSYLFGRNEVDSEKAMRELKNLIEGNEE